MKTIDDINFHNKKALVRVDFNVPLNDQQEVTDKTRIMAAKPTIEKILKDGGSCIIISHLGRPKAEEPELSLRHIVPILEKTFATEVHFTAPSVGSIARKAALDLKPGEILVLENLRFHPEETQGNADFAKQLAELADVYVNDAFGTAHRAHASTAIVADYFPHKKYAGYLLASEVEHVKKVLEDNQKPVTAIIGGAKVSSKITIIENILDKIDHLIIGGGMAFTFVKAKGGNVGSSLVEDDKLDLALQILDMAGAKGVEVHLPVDAIVADQFSSDAQTKIQLVDQISEGWMGLDTGPETNKIFRDIILKSKTILWNGPVGVFEMDRFETGTLELGKSISEATREGAFSLVGGGDSVAAVKKFKLEKEVSYVSTGGGAMLEMLEGKTLPGIKALK